MSRFAFFKDESDAEIAKRIGVQVDVLVEARQEFLERMAKEGMPDGQRIGASFRYDAKTRYKPALWFPKEIYAEWSAWRERLRTTDATLLRSVLHVVLQSPTQPAWVSKRRVRCWPFQGKWYAEQDKRRQAVWTQISEAAGEAILTRAVATKASVSAISRWGACLLIAGKLPNLRIVTTPHEMYMKPEAYCLRPQITGEEYGGKK